MKALNKKYKHEDRATDVLAFDYGEVIICFPQAKRQAKELGHSLEKELGILLIHGILHLAGQKDITKKDFDKMSKKQEEIWQKITS
jgi:probable rRNA maturation factor